MTNYDRLWQIMTNFYRLLSIMTEYDRFWQIITDYDNLWQIMTYYDQPNAVCCLFNIRLWSPKNIHGRVWTEHYFNICLCAPTSFMSQQVGIHTPDFRNSLFTSQLNWGTELIPWIGTHSNIQILWESQIKTVGLSKISQRFQVLNDILDPVTEWCEQLSFFCGRYLKVSQLFISPPLTHRMSIYWSMHDFQLVTFSNIFPAYLLDFLLRCTMTLDN